MKIKLQFFSPFQVHGPPKIYPRIPGSVNPRLRTAGLIRKCQAESNGSVTAGLADQHTAAPRTVRTCTSRFLHSANAKRINALCRPDLTEEESDSSNWKRDRRSAHCIFQISSVTGIPDTSHTMTFIYCGYNQNSHVCTKAPQSTRSQTIFRLISTNIRREEYTFKKIHVQVYCKPTKYGFQLFIK